ncbi:MAG TPA: hypothetical protein VNM39_05055, partial [Verrucomicrobiae bacterium]|nr:hypothetical protein [Verrucomicrobiae bacterium]
RELDPQRAAIVMASGLELLQADPLARFQTGSAEQERLVRELGKGEILLGSGHKAGKTHIGVAIDIALARGKRELAGIPLPALGTPNAGVVTVLDFKQQRLSVQPKFLELIGNWPHHAEWNGETLTSLRIKPDGMRSNDPRDWSSTLFVSAKNTASGTGFRGQRYLCDEPPPMWLLRELRKMGEASGMVVGVIAATMLKRSQWFPLRPDYPVEMEGKWANGFLRLRAPAFNPENLDDTSIGNRFLTRRDKEKLLEQYANDPDRDARIYGLEIDTTGASPFRRIFDELRRWLERCTDGETLPWEVTREILTVRDGRTTVTEVVEVEVWEEYDPRCVYRVIVDLSMGIDDGLHDPCEVDVFNMTRRTQAARYSGYLGEFGTGVLAAGLEKRYGTALTDPDMSGGYGLRFMAGYRAAGGKNLHRSVIRDRKGQIEREDYGYRVDGEFRAAGVSALTEALVASKSGRPYLTLRSRAMVLELMDLSTNDKEKFVTQPGTHDEGFIIASRFAMLLRPDKPALLPRPRISNDPISPVDVLRKAQGLPPRRTVGQARRPGALRPAALSRGRRG